ncbi:MAG: hypothetical protein DRI98_11630 [Bacteroidetes bacterium]|nr:MAG: hypothetical protein DRI98_11630 [Bacteroidota bacterium]
MNNQEFVKRFEQVKSDRTTVQSIWDVIETFVTPYRGRMFKDQRNEHSIEWDKRDVYDSTAVMAHQKLAASIHGALTSPSIRWFDLRFRDEKLNKNSEAKRWLESASERCYYELQDSNFNLEINEVYQDLCGPATAFLTLEEAPGPSGNWNGLNFASVPLKEGYFETDWRGTILRFYRLLSWTPAQIISRFGDEVPQSIKDAEEKGATDKREVLFVIYPRGNRIVPVGQKASPSKRSIAYRYMLRDTAEELGKEGGYYEMPAYAARWRTTSESIWGNGPAHVAIADILSLNEARKMQLKASEKLIDPPIFAEERALLSDLNLAAASLSVVRDIDGVKPFETHGSIATSDAMVEQLQRAVKEYFFTDALALPAPQAQPMTAFEVQKRYEEIQRFMGPTLSRLINDILDPTLSRVFRMLWREGQLDEPPQVVVDAQAQFDVVYLGALSRAQRVDEATSIDRWVNSAAVMGEAFPDGLDIVDIDEALRHSGRSLNVPATIIRSETEVKKIRDERQAKQRAMEEAAIAQAQGDAAQSVAAGEQAVGETGEAQ